MRRTMILAGVLLSLVSSASHAMWAGMRLESVATQSDLIVVATLSDTRSHREAGMDVVEGPLVVERVIWGDVAPGDTLLLRWQNYPEVACPRVENGRYTGTSQIWFLTRDADGVVHADHPDRVMPPTEFDTVVDTMRAYPYRVITPRFDIGEPVNIDIIFRNATDAPIEVPAMEISQGRMTYGTGFDFRPQLHEQNWVPRADARFQPDSTMAPLTLAPGESRRVTIPLSELVGELPPATHRFEMVVNGRVMQCNVQVLSAWTTRLERVRDTPAEIDFYLATLRDTTQAQQSALMMLRLKRSETVRVAPQLMALCDSLPVAIRVQVIQLITILDFDADSRLDFLLERIHHPDARVRGAAGYGIGMVMQMGIPADRRVEAGNALIQLLGDEDPGVRGAAINSVSNARVIGALPTLKSIIEFDAHPGNRESARRSVNVLEGRNPCRDRPARAD